MKPEDAAKKLSFHLMQCGALMPMDWIRENGEGSELQQAFRMALDALRDGERLRTELEHVKRERDAAIRDLEMVSVCDTCVHEHAPSCPGCNDAENWEWRGPEEGRAWIG